MFDLCEQGIYQYYILNKKNKGELKLCPYFSYFRYVF